MIFKLHISRTDLKGPWLSVLPALQLILLVFRLQVWAGRGGAGRGRAGRGGAAAFPLPSLLAPPILRSASILGTRALSAIPGKKVRWLHSRAATCSRPASPPPPPPPAAQYFLQVFRPTRFNLLDTIRAVLKDMRMVCLWGAGEVAEGKGERREGEERRGEERRGVWRPRQGLRA